MQLSAPELIDQEPVSLDGKTVRLEWKSVENAVSYKACGVYLKNPTFTTLRALCQAASGSLCVFV